MNYEFDDSPVGLNVCNREGTGYPNIVFPACKATLYPASRPVTLVVRKLRTLDTLNLGVRFVIKQELRELMGFSPKNGSVRHKPSLFENSIELTSVVP